MRGRVPLEYFTDCVRRSLRFSTAPGREFVNHVCDRLSNDFFNDVLSPTVSPRQDQRKDERTLWYQGAIICSEGSTHRHDVAKSMEPLQIKV